MSDPKSGSGEGDRIKGRAKEATGAISDDEKLKREGRADQAQGKIKKKIDQAIEKTRKKLRG